MPKTKFCNGCSNCVPQYMQLPCLLFKLPEENAQHAGGEAKQCICAYSTPQSARNCQNKQTVAAFCALANSAACGCTTTVACRDAWTSSHTCNSCKQELAPTHTKQGKTMRTSTIFLCAVHVVEAQRCEHRRPEYA